MLNVIIEHIAALISLEPIFHGSLLFIWISRAAQKYKLAIWRKINRKEFVIVPNTREYPKLFNFSSTRPLLCKFVRRMSTLSVICHVLRSRKTTRDCRSYVETSHACWANSIENFSSYAARSCVYIAGQRIIRLFLPCSASNTVNTKVSTPIFLLYLQPYLFCLRYFNDLHAISHNKIIRGNFL